MNNGNDTVRTRIKVAAVFWIPIAAALAVRFYVVQVKNHEYYLTEAKKCYTSVRKTSGRRGEILDRNGYLIVGNRPCVQISCSPCEIKSPLKRKRLAALLNIHLGKDFDYYYERLNPVRPRRDGQGRVMLDANGQPEMRPNTFLALGRTVPIDTAANLKNDLRANDIPLGAFSFLDTYTRTYPKKRMLSNIIGYINIENDAPRPKVGLEKQLDDATSPETGRIREEISRDGTPLDYGLQNISAARDGKNIYLTVSEPIQAILEEELDAAYAKWNPEAIYAAIADPEGNILAIAQRPNYDPADRSTFSNDAIRTRIAMDSFEPGSVAKPFTVGKALDWGVVTPNTRIDCEHGRWVYLGKPMRDTHDNDRLTVGEVIQKSSNIGTAKIALLLGEKRFCEAFSSFGFGSRTELPLPGETRGTPIRIRKGDGLAITRMPIGYSVRVTALQMLRAYCTLANGGRRPQLRLIDRLEDPATGEIMREPQQPAVQLFEHPEALEQLVGMMITVTQKGGTATQAAIKGYDVAGKTGTSHKYIEGRGYSPNQYYASFAGFVPARNPKIVMVIATDSPKGSHFGGTVSAPVFSKTAERVLKLMNVPPDHPEPAPETKAEQPPKATPAAVATAKPAPGPAKTVPPAAPPAPIKPAAKPAPKTTAKPTPKPAVPPASKPAAKPAAKQPKKSVRPAPVVKEQRPRPSGKSEFPMMAPVGGDQKWR